MVEDEALIEAARRGAVDDLTLMLRQGGNANACRTWNEAQTESTYHGEETEVVSQEETALIAAVEAGQIPCVDLLLNAGADPNLSRVRSKFVVWLDYAENYNVTRKIEYPLTLAVQQNRSDIARRLLQAKADPNAGEPALVLASALGNEEMARLLLEANARPDAPGDPYWTLPWLRTPHSPLWWALQNGHYTIALRLLETNVALDNTDLQQVRNKGDEGMMALLLHRDITLPQ